MFEAVCAHAAPAVFGVVRSVVRDPFQAEEVFREVLLEVWRCASRFQPCRDSAMARVTTVHGRAIDRVRSEHRSAERQLRAASHKVAYDEVAETVEDSLDPERARHCLGSLTELQRESARASSATASTRHWNPRLRLLRREVEGLVKTRHGAGTSGNGRPGPSRRASTAS